jgi:hypothetical protein
MKFCGEIAYDRENGAVHSDICFNNSHLHDEEASVGEQPNKQMREFLHNCLDEWLERSNGTGAFWVGDPSYFHSP